MEDLSGQQRPETDKQKFVCHFMSCRSLVPCFFLSNDASRSSGNHSCVISFSSPIHLALLLLPSIMPIIVSLSIPSLIIINVVVLRLVWPSILLQSARDSVATAAKTVVTAMPVKLKLIF